MLAKELKLWSSLHHPNILPIYGFSIEDIGCLNFSFISEWMENGTADKYVQSNANCNIGLLVRKQVTEVLYQYSKKVFL